MIKYRPFKDICFDDILLVPQRSEVLSRKNIDISMNDFVLPIVSSPMDTVTEWELAVAIADEGGLGIIHRYISTQERLNQAKLALEKTTNKSGIGIAISSFEALDTTIVEDAIALGVKWFCIDTASGHNVSCIDAVKTLKEKYPDIKLMAGNIATGEGFIELAQAGADAIRVGIGGGATCKTRVVSGHGVPTLQSIMDAYEFKTAHSSETLIVADGGIKTTGDVVKAFAAGADLVMLGSMLSGTDESPGEIVAGKKVFRGMASSEAQLDWRGTVSVEEGVSVLVKHKGSVKKVIEEIKGGIGSGCSYSGVSKLSDLASVALYVEVSSLAKNESGPHAEVKNA